MTLKRVRSPYDPADHPRTAVRSPDAPTRLLGQARGRESRRGPSSFPPIVNELTTPQQLAKLRAADARPSVQPSLRSHVQEYMADKHGVRHPEIFARGLDHPVHLRIDRDLPTVKIERVGERIVVTGREAILDRISPAERTIYDKVQSAQARLDQWGAVRGRIQDTLSANFNSTAILTATSVAAFSTFITRRTAGEDAGQAAVNTVRDLASPEFMLGHLVGGGLGATAGSLLRVPFSAATARDHRSCRGGASPRRPASRRPLGRHPSRGRSLMSPREAFIVPRPCWGAPWVTGHRSRARARHCRRSRATIRPWTRSLARCHPRCAPRNDSGATPCLDSRHCVRRLNIAAGLLAGGMHDRRAGNASC